MSGCKCEASRCFRVTGEVIDRPPLPNQKREIGTGSKIVRIRCAECGGKVAHVGSDLLNVLGVPDSEIRNGRILEESERITLKVDLI